MSLPHDNVPPQVSSLMPVPRAPHTLTMCKLVVDNYVTQKILLEIALVSVQQFYFFLKNYIGIPIQKAIRRLRILPV